MHPRLLTSLILVDPVIQLFSGPASSFEADSAIARSSTFRRDRWPSRAEAVASFRKSKFYQLWDPRVLDLWLEHGLRRLPTPIYPSTSSETSAHRNVEKDPVTLTTNKHQEVFMFIRPNFHGMDADGKMVANRQTHPDLDLDTGGIYPFYAPASFSVFKNLQHLRPSALYVFGGTSEMSTPHLRRAKLAVTGTGVSGSGGAEEGRVREVVVEGVGHLVPMVAPKKTADAAAEFLAAELQRWRREEEEWRVQWQRKGRMERMTVDDEWKRQIGGDPRAPSKL